MEPIEYLRLFRRRWRLVVACVLVAAAAAWVTTPSSSQSSVVTYLATTTLLRDAEATAPVALPTVALFVETGDVPGRVAQRLDLGSGRDAASLVDVEIDEISASLRITAEGSTREEAAERANVFAEETLGYLGGEAQTALTEALADVAGRIAELEQQVNDLEEQIDAAEEAGDPTAVLEAQRDSKASQYALALDEQEQLRLAPAPSAGYLVLETATADAARVAGSGFEAPRSRTVRVGLAIALGLALGLGLVILAERLDPRLFTREEVEAAFGLPVVAEVPVLRRPPESIVTVDEPSSSGAEAYRSLRAALVLSHAQRLGATADGASTLPAREPRVVLVTSPAPGDGKTTTVANLAAGFGEAGRSVLVLGCDFRRPEVHRFFGVPVAPGLADSLRQHTIPDLRAVVRKTSVPGVSLAPSGSDLANPGDVAAEGQRLVITARQLAEMVIIDTAPVLATNEAVELMAAVDAVVIVARAGRTTKEAARRTRELLERMGASVAGVVLVGVATPEAAYASYYADDGTKRRGRRRRSARHAAAPSAS